MTKLYPWPQPRLIVHLLIFLSFVLPTLAQAGLSTSNPLIKGKTQLLAIYGENKNHLQNNPLNKPVIIRSEIAKDQVSGNVYAILKHNYATVSTLLADTTNWCAALGSHVNVKSCTTETNAEHENLVNFYVGLSGYQEPEDTHVVQYRQQVHSAENDYLHVSLFAEDGPYDTQDYQMILEIIPLDEHHSFINFAYSMRYGFFSNFILHTYLATFGRNKVGFTRIGNDQNGEPLYITGVQGVIERNAMRYFLAIQSFLNTYHLPAEQRFEARINLWYQSIMLYKTQLYEQDKQEYLENKREEHQNQLQLQLVLQQN